MRRKPLNPYPSPEAEAIIRNLIGKWRLPWWIKRTRIKRAFNVKFGPALCAIGCHVWRYSDGGGTVGHEDTERECLRCDEAQTLGYDMRWRRTRAAEAGERIWSSVFVVILIALGCLAAFFATMQSEPAAIVFGKSGPILFK